MNVKYYEINGEKLNIDEIVEKYHTSKSTFYRRLKEGLSTEKAIEQKPRSEYKKREYAKKEYVDYPSNFILDLLGSNRDFTYDMNSIKKNFEVNFNQLISDNRDFFNDTELEIFNKHYREGMMYITIADELQVSKQRVDQINSNFLAKLRKPYFSDYYLMGIGFINQRETYYSYREKELVDKLGIREFETEKPRLSLMDGKTLKVTIGIERLRLPESIENALIENGIDTVDKLIVLSKSQLRGLKKLGNVAYKRIMEALREFEERVEFYV